MPTPLQAHAAFITKVRVTITTLFNDSDILFGLRQQYDRANLVGSLTSTDFTAEINNDITLAQFNAAMSSISALNTFLNAANGVNLSLLRNS